jgi:putative exosortase-associated protein (TIGR04073 family)
MPFSVDTFVKKEKTEMRVPRFFPLRAGAAPALAVGCLIALSLPAAAISDEAPSKSKLRSYTIQRGTVVPTSVIPVEPGKSAVVEKRRGGTGGPLRELSVVPKMTRKLWRGAHNTFLGWIELPKNILQETAMLDPFSGFLVGAVKGSAKTVERTGIGIVEVFTFWHDWPQEYGPIIEPEFVLDDFND